ncbi:hypothetical protein BOTBODRAFT_178008 [Botryobasidium botryosum FD-172 SS1]|uniref:Uncharacterized protein n=1 Tax=Botryobasidium botryosum (strain FD-172 SS1) TaxID=930990 RepID=A0A067M7Q3_BOTB1|nr:hypothetical protein BOTBODRAFT_178008 [Botryobasidium botryosum FD-172 SS1]
MSSNDFTTQPHPAKSNDPNDLKQHEGGGLQSHNPFKAFEGAGPVIPDNTTLSKLGEPLSKEELKKRSEELNRE